MELIGARLGFAGCFSIPTNESRASHSLTAISLSLQPIGPRKRVSVNRLVDCVAGRLSGGVERAQGNRGSFDSLRCAPVAQDDSPVLVGWLCHRQTGDKRERKQILRSACPNALRAPGPQAAPLRMTPRWVGPEVVLRSGWQGFGCTGGGAVGARVRSVALRRHLVAEDGIEPSTLGL